MAETKLKEEVVEPQSPNQCRFCNAERDLNLNVFTSNGTTEYYKLINQHVPLNIHQDDGYSPIVCYVCMFELTLYTELVRKYIKFRNSKITTAIMKQSCYFCGKGNINYDIPVDIRKAVKKIEHCIAMKNKMNDGSPLHKKKVWFYYGKICHDCYFLVDTSFKLYEKAQHTDKQLKEIMDENGSDEEDIEESEGYGSSGECSSEVGNIKKELKEEDEEEEEEEEDEEDDDELSAMNGTEEFDGSIKTELDDVKEEDEDEDEEEESELPGGIKIKDEPLIDYDEEGADDMDPLDTGDFDPLAGGKKIKVKDEPMSEDEEEEMPEDDDEEEEMYNPTPKGKKRGGKQAKTPAKDVATPKKRGRKPAAATATKPAPKGRGRGKKAAAAAAAAAIPEDDEEEEDIASKKRKVEAEESEEEEIGESSAMDPLGGDEADPLQHED